MIYWIDAQLPPQLAVWLGQTFNVEAYALRDQLEAGGGLQPPPERLKTSTQTKRQ
jgi:hypothetical protein